MNHTNTLSERQTIQRGMPTALQHKQAASWIEISRAAFEHNVATYRAIMAPKVALYVVIKANAYGHGALQIAQLCQEIDGVTGLCVFVLSDALMLRQRGITKPILVFGHIDASLEDAISQEIHLTVFTQAFLEKINRVAERVGKKALIHLKVDTGLSRAGFFPHDAIQVLNLIATNHFSHIALHGIYSHFAESDAQDLQFTTDQQAAFQKVIDHLVQLPLEPVAIHLSNSTGVLRIPSAHYTAVRSGGGMWGIAKSDRIKAEVRARYPDFDLKPIMTWKSRLMSLKWVPEGSLVSYGCTYKTTRKTRLACIPVGYFDGYPRQLSNKAVVIIDGQIAPIRGRICMNVIIADITDIPTASYESDVILIGNHPLVNIEYLSQQIGTITYDVLVGIHPSIERIIV